MDFSSTPEYEIGNAPVEIRTIFVLLHLLSFGDTQLDKYEIENPMIIVTDFKKSHNTRMHHRQETLCHALHEYFVSIKV